jgi:hypothetical protein
MLGGGALGMLLSMRLPEAHKEQSSKDAVRLTMALVATMLAVVLGLLTSSAKTFYDQQRAELNAMTANVVQLGRELKLYGPQAAQAHQTLARAVAGILDSKEKNGWSPETPAQRRDEAEIFTRIVRLAPENDGQRILKADAVNLMTQFARMRWLMFEQRSTGIPAPLLAIVIFWQTALFISYGLFTRANVTVAVSIAIASIVVSAALFLIVEMFDPLSGLMQLSDEPLRATLRQLQL